MIGLHGSLWDEFMSDGIKLSVEASGCGKEGIEIMGRPDGTLTISLPETDFYPSVVKRIKAPDGYDTTKAKAIYKDGLLKIEIPFKDEAVGSKIEIK